MKPQINDMRYDELSDKHVFVQYESNVRSYSRAFPHTFVKARGTELWDLHGRRFLDFLSGAGSLNYGHNNPVFKEALVEYILQDGITHSLDLHTMAKAQFIDAMQTVILKPRGFDYVIQFTGPTGTNAVEAALKLARKVTGRTNIICFTNSFHGVSLGALSVTGNKNFRCAAGVPLYGATSMPYDGYCGKYMDTIEFLDRMLSDSSSGLELPAAIIVEVVQGEGGLNTASIKWLRNLQNLCKEKRIIMVVDDIQAGCGRTGTFFSFEPAGIKPDIVTLSKSLSGFGLPLSVVLFERSLDVWKPGEHNGTFRGNNHAFVTATVALNHYWRNKEFTESLREKGEYLTAQLQALVDRFHPHLIDVKGRGMMIGVRCANPEQAAAVTERAFRHGLIIERCGPRDEVIKCMQPLTSSYQELNEGVDILLRASKEVFKF